MLVLFLDESGDHSLGVIDPQYPMFVLGGVIMDQAYAEGEAEERVRRFKRELFGSEDLVLHTADLTRNRNGFERMAEPAFRQRFYAGLNELMRTLDYQVVACAIRKDAHLRRYGLAAIDPYMSRTWWCRRSGGLCWASRCARTSASSRGSCAGAGAGTRMRGWWCCRRGNRGRNGQSQGPLRSPQLLLLVYRRGDRISIELPWSPGRSVPSGPTRQGAGLTC